MTHRPICTAIQPVRSNWMLWYSLLIAACLSACTSSVPATLPEDPAQQMGPSGEAVGWIVAVQNGDPELAAIYVAPQSLREKSYCNDSAFSCFQNDIASAGQLTKVSAREIALSESNATVELRMTWSEWGEICQRFELVRLDTVWKISLIGAPTPCSE